MGRRKSNAHSSSHRRSIPCRGCLLRLLASAVWPSRLPKVVINGTLVALPLNLSHYMSLVVDKFLEGGGRGSEGRMRAACASASRQGRRKRTDLSSPWRFCGCFHSSLRKITIISNLGLPLILAEPVDFFFLSSDTAHVVFKGFQPSRRSGGLHEH